MKMTKPFSLTRLKRLSYWIPSASLTLTGCAGPHTPLGAVWTLTPAEAAGEIESASRAPASPASDPGILITPSKQILHDATPLKVEIRDSRGDLKNYDLAVRYNGFDVTRSFLLRSRLHRLLATRTLVIENPLLRLPADQEHSIEFSYQNRTGHVAYARFESPVCYAFKPQPVKHTGPFQVEPQVISSIRSSAEKEGFNPALMTGLIAQESRFNPQSVSRAKAIGLTQITSIAEEEVAALHPEWPRFPGVTEMSPATVKLHISTGHMNEKNEWRLNPLTSIEGGIAFARMLADRWSSAENQEKIRSLGRDPEALRTQLVLASYHSGYSRVQNAIEQYGKDWLKSPDLKEARKYVNKIFSYCSFFSEETGGGKKNARTSKGI